MSRSDEPAREEMIETRLTDIEREMVREGLLEMATVRRLFHGLSDIPSDTDPVTKVDAIIKRIATLETEVQRLQAQLRTQHTQQKGSKKERAKRLARNEVLRQIDRGTNPIGDGGSVDVPTVITIGHGIGIEFTHKTVGDAFQAIATKWDAFAFQAGSGTKKGANKRLVATNDEIPETLWQIYAAEMSETATPGDTIAESSNDSNGGH